MRPHGAFCDSDPEATWWASVDVVIAEIAKAGFSLTSRSDLERPWQGIQAVFRL